MKFVYEVRRREVSKILEKAPFAVVVLSLRFIPRFVPQKRGER